MTAGIALEPFDGIAAVGYASLAMTGFSADPLTGRITTTNTLGMDSKDILILRHCVPYVEISK